MFLFGIVLVVVLVVTSRIIRPIRELTDFTRRVKDKNRDHELRSRKDKDVLFKEVDDRTRKNDEIHDLKKIFKGFFDDDASGKSPSEDGKILVTHYSFPKNIYYRPAHKAENLRDSPRMRNSEEKKYKLEEFDENALENERGTNLRRGRYLTRSTRVFVCFVSVACRQQREQTRSYRSDEH